jgi:putative ABC transport system permease protein
VFASTSERFNLAPGGETRFADGLIVSGDFFGTLGIGAYMGRTLSVADDVRGCDAGVPAAVLSYQYWQTQYAGDAAIVGKAVRIGKHSFEIVGVSPRGFFGVTEGHSFDIAIPLCSETLIYGANTRYRRYASWLSVIGRLKPGVTMTQLNARLKLLTPQDIGGGPSR